MSTSRDDLVGLALNALDAAESERVQRSVEADPALAAELGEIERHLALHDDLPHLRPAPALWYGIRDRIDARPAPRSFLGRFWMPAAAALLVAVALFWPASEPGRGRKPYQRLHGDVAEAPGGTLTCTTVSRLRLVNGVTVTMDARTAISGHSPRSKRLVIATGRVFLEVAENARGFTVEAGDLEVVTTGTAFLVEARGVVWVESGTVRCRSAKHGEAAVTAGKFFPLDAAPGLASPRAWFTRPTLAARIIDADTIRVVVRNDMPDSLQVAPRTGGEPLFFASYLGGDYPLSPGRFDAPLTLAPNTDKSFLLRLPRSLPDREALFVAYPAGRVSVEAKR